MDEDLSDKLNGSSDKLHKLCLVLLCPVRRLGGSGGGELFWSVFFNQVLKKKKCNKSDILIIKFYLFYRSGNGGFVGGVPSTVSKE